MAKVITVTVPGNPVDVITLQPDMSPVSVITVSIPGQQGPGGPQGITGAPGPSSVLSIGTVTTGAAGSAASATLTGVSPNQTLNLTIPRGATGNTGAAPTLSMGTINTLAEGQAATATLTGTTAAPILNLGIPRGYGVRAGGTTGQVLHKLSATDHDTGWSTLTAASVTDSTATGRSLMTATDAPAARTAISAVSSSDSRLTDARTPVAHTHPSTDISDSSSIGRSVLAATTTAIARSAIGAGTSSLVIGTTATTAKAGNYQPTAANISDSTATGRSLITATDAAAARTTLAVPSTAYAETRYKRIIPATEGLALTGYGHSYLDGRWNAIGPGQKYIDRVNHRLGTVLDNNGFGGGHMQDCILDAIGGRDPNRNWPVGERGLAIIDCIHNDATKWQLDPVGMNSWEQSLRSLIGFMSADAAWVLDNTWSFTYSGGWTDAAHMDFYNNGGLKSLAANATGNITWTHSIPGRWGFAFAGTSVGGRDMEIVRNNVVVASFNTKQAKDCGHTGAGGGTRGHNLFTTFIDIPDGSHTMIIRPKVGGVATDVALFDFAYRVNVTDPVKVFLPAGLPAYNLSDAGYAQYNARLQAVANEFPNAYYVPTSAGYNKATMIGVDGVHLSPLGTEFMADVLTEFIRDVFE